MKSRTERHLVHSVLLLLAIVAVACGKSGNSGGPKNTAESLAQLEIEPSQTLRPTQATKTKSKYYDIYDLVEAKVSADITKLSIGARVLIRSSAGEETVELAGRIRPDGSATLVDLKPLPNGMHRLSAEAFCVDIKKCDPIILNVFFKVGNRTLKKQFVSEAIVKKGNATATDTHDKNDDIVDDEEEKANFDHGAQDETDPNSELLVGEEQLGEFVGAARNEEMIKKLWDRPKDAKLAESEIDEEEAAEPNLAPVSGDSSDAVVTSGPKTRGKYRPKHKAQNSTADYTVEPATAPVASATGASGAAAGKSGRVGKTQTQPAVVPAPVQEKAKPVKKSGIAPIPQSPDQIPKPATPAKAKKSGAIPEMPAPVAPIVVTPSAPSGKAGRVRPSAPEAANENAKNIPEVSRDPAPKKEATPRAERAQPAPVKEPKTKQKKTTEVEAEEPPQVPEAPDKTASLERIRALESKISPYLDLTQGGRAVGDYNNGRLENGTTLAKKGEGFRQANPGRDTLWGAGMMVSMLKNLSAYFVKTYYPGISIMLGDISRKMGGKYGNHKSHQIGLDADIAFIGNDSMASAVNNRGNLNGSYDYEKNWQFLRLIASQQFVQDGKRVSVLGRVFINPVIKVGICSWAKKKNILTTDLDKEIMRRIRPTDGHTSHFHVRIRCSPHYPACRNQLEPPTGTGC